MIQREVLEVQKRVLGAEHPETLTSAGNLASSLIDQGMYAEMIEREAVREVLLVHRRLHGEENEIALTTAGKLAGNISRAGQDKFAEAEQIQREVLGVQKRVLGAEHPDTLLGAHDYALSLSRQGKHAEAEHMLQATLASLQRVLGPAHPSTLTTARSLEEVRARIRATPPPTNAAAPVAHPLPAGTCVLVQRLVAKPEHNGKRARVVSFDARTGRYAVALDDGKELSLKAECVARAGCAAAGCASEEASSVCGRCQVVRYCSRESQRTDWKAHKPRCLSCCARRS